MTKSVRLANYIIDMFVIFFITFCIDLGLDSIDIFSSSIYFVMFFYYITFEAYNGQTIGKRITKTKVIDKYGKRPSFLKLFMRSVLRLIPIDGLSYLFGSEQGFHDKLSSTRLVKK